MNNTLMKIKSKHWLSLSLFVLVASALGAGPTAMSVQVKTTQVREQPSFLGKVVTLLNYGDRLQVGELQGD